MSLGPQVLAALEAAFNPNPEVRLSGQNQLNQYKSASPDPYFRACVEILISPSCSLVGRQLAGFELKNNLAHPACGQNSDIISGILQSGVVDEQRRIRKVSSSIVSLAVREALWPVQSVIPHLCSMLTKQGTSLAPVHGAMLAVSKIVDDCVVLLDVQQVTGVVVDSVVPYLTAAKWGLTEEAVDVRLKALDTILIVLEQAGMDFDGFSFHATKATVLPIIEACFANLENPISTKIAAKCISCIVFSLAHQDQISDVLFARMVELMVKATLHEGAAEEDLQIAAVQFWSAVLHFPKFAQRAAEAIHQIIPTLIKSMVYSEMEIGMLTAGASDWQQEDKEEEIRPRHFQSKVQSTNDEDDEDAGDEEVEEWNLRRVSARTLDDISAYFGEPILAPTLNIISQWIDSSASTADWKYLEAAVLAFGAITEGCLHAMGPFLPTISSHLLGHLANQSTHFLVICTVLWCCEQIVEYMISTPETLDALVKAVLARMQSPSKKVQESATSTLQVLISECDVNALEPYAASITETCAKCLSAYQLKNRLLLLETIGPFCEKMGPILMETGTCVGDLLEPLGAIWVGTRNDSVALFSLFECMSSVCGSLGSVLAPEMVQAIFDRAFLQMQEQMKRRDEDEDAAEYVVTAADLISGLLDGLGSSLEPYLSRCQNEFLQLVMAMVRDESNSSVRQSGFCLCGDMSKAFPTYIQAILPLYVEALLLNFSSVTESTYRVLSNAAWSLCNLLENEVMINDLPLLSGSSYINSIFAAMAKIFVETDLTVDMRNMAENVALALGLMICMDPEVLNRSGCPVTYISKRFCEYARNMKQELPQKTQALNGYIRAMLSAPHGAADHVFVVIDLACAMYSEPPDTLAGMAQLLQAVAQSCPDKWKAALQSCRAQQKTTLHQVYGVLS